MKRMDDYIRLFFLFPLSMKNFKKNAQSGNQIVPSRSALDQFFPSSFWEMDWPQSFLNETNFVRTPTCDISETDREIIFELEAPGFDSKDISVEVDDDILSIRGEHEEKSETKKKRYFQRERQKGTFYREFSLPKYADVDHIKSKIKKGMLKITIPKKEKGQKKQISTSDS